jgi:uncharacterized protein (TIGR03435 family)
MYSLVSLAFLTAVAQAQTPATAPIPKAFEVASIKPNSSSDNRIAIRMAPGGSFNATGITLRLLMGQAFNMRDHQIIGGPGWIASDRWDVQAKGPDGMPDRVPPEMLRPMLQSLITERFQLKYHTESREMPVYVLTVAKGGPKMKESEVQPGPGGPGGPGGGGPQRMMRMGRGQLNASGVPIQFLVQQLAQQLGRTVIDKTGLTGFYDFDLQWTPEPGHGGGGPFGGGAPPPPDAMPAATDNSGPTIFTALQEKLGLKLETAKGPVDVLIVDSVSKPSEN